MKLFFKKYWAEIINSIIGFIMLIVLPITYKPLREMFLIGRENDYWMMLGGFALMFSLLFLPWEKWYKKIKRP